MEHVVSAEEKIRSFPERCHKAGLKVTQQRREIYALLAASLAHPCPEEIYEQIRDALPSLSLATVYKIVDQFHRHGLLRKVPTRSQVARYDARTDEHHHLVCTACDRIEDVFLPPLPPRMTRLPSGTDFQAQSYELVFHGLCSACGATAQT
jgi:Fur family peroxide stress response transcriptional regulator